MNEFQGDQEQLALDYLRMFTADTYGINIPRPLAKIMEGRGWIKWVPPKFGTTMYDITDIGRAALAQISK